MPAARAVDESFLALPLSALTDAALTRALDLGCEHADIRVERIRTQTISLRDARPEAVTDGEDLGLSVRVVHEGTWGLYQGKNHQPKPHSHCFTQAQVFRLIPS